MRLSWCCIVVLAGVVGLRSPADAEPSSKAAPLAEGFLHAGVTITPTVPAELLATAPDGGEHRLLDRDGSPTRGPTHRFLVFFLLAVVGLLGALFGPAIARRGVTRRGAQQARSRFAGPLPRARVVERP